MWGASESLLAAGISWSALAKARESAVQPHPPERPTLTPPLGAAPARSAASPTPNLANHSGGRQGDTSEKALLSGVQREPHAPYATRTADWPTDQGVHNCCSHSVSYHFHLAHQEQTAPDA
uniref:Uncharacterized protein n=1 Tax=Arundo donax TaxID=35708 RepID=A0A0A9HBR4_ARUDO